MLNLHSMSNWTEEVWSWPIWMESLYKLILSSRKERQAIQTENQVPNPHEFTRRQTWMNLDLVLLKIGSYITLKPNLNCLVSV